MIDPNAPIRQADRDGAAVELTRLINDNLFLGIRDEDGYPIEIEPREMKRFIQEHWERISRYAHLIHGSE
jgi:hypothetical protein